MSSKVFRAQCKFILPLAAALMSACAERVADSPNVPLTSTPLAALTAESARTVRFAFDQATSAVTTIRGRFAVAPAADSPAAARGFLTRHAQALRLREDLTDLHLARHTQDPGGEVLAFAQRHQGVRVVGADVVVGFDPTGAIIHVQNDTVPDLTLSTQPKLAAERALALASQHLGHELLGATARLVIVRGDKASPGYHLAFEVAGLVSKPRSDWFIYVDARSGNIVRARNRIKSTGAACTPCTPGAAGCGLVFEYDPVSALNDTTLLDTSNVDIAMRGCVLNNLTSATNLNGTWVNTSITATRATAPFNYARSASQQKADEVTVYYHLNRAKEYLNAMGYPGVMNFSINTDAHDPTLGDNAHYVPSTKILEFGEGGTDDAQDPSVVYHEYGHAIQDNQVPNFGATDEGGAMGEGFGDYYGASLTDEVNATVLGAACVGPWDAVAYAPFTGAAGTGCLRRTDSTKIYPQNLAHQVHADGEIWSSALWTIRQALGPTVADPLVIKSHTFLTANANFINGADGLMSADQALYGGAHAAAIGAALKARGIPRTGTAGTTTGLANTSAFSCGISNYGANAYKECRFTQPGAAKLRVHFTSFATEAGYDFAFVSDADYRQVQSLAGSPFGAAGGYSAVVTGDTIVVRFTSDASVQAAGWQIDQVQYQQSGCTDISQCNRCAGETCVAGACVAGPALNCNDSNPCTTDTCTNAAGCVNTPVANNTSCSDGNACNGAETCQAGQCQAGTPLVCNDGNVCNGIETCNPASGCVAGSALNCNDGNPCTADSCDAQTGCANTIVADGAACGDGNLCNGAEACLSGQCKPGTPLDCNDNDLCTTDACNPATGCTHATINCNDSNACTADSCNPATGCVNAPVAEGTSCGDGNACNGAETCVAGTCTAGTAPNCDDGNQCTNDSCSPATGCVNTARDCTNGNVCLVGSCTPAAGCSTTPVANGTVCPTGTCQNGACAAPSCTNFTGTVTTSARNAYHTIGVRTTGTVLDGTLSCTVTASDGDLYLQVFKSNAWRNVASALGLTCAEAIRYTVPASNSGLQFRYRVYLYTGTNTAYLLRSCP